MKSNAFFPPLQTRMAVFSAQHVKQSMGRKQAHNLLGKWSITSSPTAFPDTQTPRPFVSSMTFLPGFRLCHSAKSTLVLLFPDSLSLLFRCCLCGSVRCKSLDKQHSLGSQRGSGHGRTLASRDSILAEGRGQYTTTIKKIPEPPRSKSEMYNIETLNIF